MTKDEVLEIAERAGFRILESTFGGRYVPTGASKTKYDNCLFNKKPDDLHDLTPELMKFAELVLQLKSHE